MPGKKHGPWLASKDVFAARSSWAGRFFAHEFKRRKSSPGSNVTISVAPTGLISSITKPLFSSLLVAPVQLAGSNYHHPTQRDFSERGYGLVLAARRKPVCV